MTSKGFDIKKTLDDENIETPMSTRTPMKSRLPNIKMHTNISS